MTDSSDDRPALPRNRRRLRQRPVLAAVSAVALLVVIVVGMATGSGLSRLPVLVITAGIALISLLTARFGRK